MCLEFNIVDFFCLEVWKSLKLKEKNVKPEEKKLFYYEYHIHKISKGFFFSFYLAIV